MRGLCEFCAAASWAYNEPEDLHYHQLPMIKHEISFVVSVLVHKRRRRGGGLFEGYGAYSILANRRRRGLFEGALIWGEALIRGGFTVFHLFNPLTPVPVVTGRDKRRFFPFNVITFGQNWYQLYSNSVRGKDPSSDTQIRVIGSIGPEICTRILWNLSEKLGVKFPSSTLGYSMETISRLDDGSWRPTTATKR